MSESKPPPAIRSHPLFAPFCGLWLGALLGLAAWIVPIGQFPPRLATLGQLPLAIISGVAGVLIGYAGARLSAPRRKKAVARTERKQEEEAAGLENAEEPRRSRRLVVDEPSEPSPEIIEKPELTPIDLAPRQPLAVEELVGTVVQFDAPEEPDDDPPEPFEGLPEKFRSPLDGKPLDELGTTELLERLAVALHRRLAGA